MQALSYKSRARMHVRECAIAAADSEAESGEYEPIHCRQGASEANSTGVARFFMSVQASRKYALCVSSITYM